MVLSTGQKEPSVRFTALFQGLLVHLSSSFACLRFDLSEGEPEFSHCAIFGSFLCFLVRNLIASFACVRAAASEIR